MSAAEWRLEREGHSARDGDGDEAKCCRILQGHGHGHGRDALLTIKDLLYKSPEGLSPRPMDRDEEKEIETRKEAERNRVRQRQSHRRRQRRSGRAR